MGAAFPLADLSISGQLWEVALPDISNNVGPVKSFFERTTPFTPKSGLRCSLLTSHRRPRLVP